MLRLYTFTISHFSEKARWALDLEGVRYDEKRLLPGPHLPFVRSMAPKSSVPVLVHDGHVVQGSSDIIDYASEQLGSGRLKRAAAPTGTRDLETLADEAFGLGIQRIFYDVLLSDRRATTELWTQGGPRWGRGFYAVAFAGVATAVRRMYQIRPDVVARTKERFREGIAATDRALARTPFLDGDAPGRTDVTVAALLAPMCRPKEHVLRWPAELPAPLAAFIREFEGGPTWNHVLRMYRDHRRAH
jgi:glutathione S-transferase